MFVCLFVYKFVCLFVCLLVSLFVSLFVCYTHDTESLDKGYPCVLHNDCVETPDRLRVERNSYKMVEKLTCVRHTNNIVCIHTNALATR